MDFNLITNAEQCHKLIEETVPLALVYYSHIPTAMISIFVGLFVFLKNRSLIGKVLFWLSVTFSLWLVFDLIIWVANYNTALTMFSWSLLGILDILFFILSLYFVYLFIDKHDISFFKKTILGVLFLPVILLTSTRINLSGFSLDSCESMENDLFLNYIFYLEIIISIWIIALSIARYFKSDKIQRKQILLLSLGIIVFLLSFFGAGYIAAHTNNYDYELYGHFGMTFFMGMLAYMIVRFKTFNIKLIGAQALVVTLFILIAAQFAFIRNPTNMILNGVALFLITIFGYMLIRGVKREILQREALALANTEISERKEQLQRISDHLAVANDKLKELDTAKNEFVSIVAHQLQGPPTTVKGYSMLLSDGTYGEMTSDQKEVLGKIFNANEQQIDFVRDLLNVSRLESGRINFAFETCGVTDICQEVIDNLFVKAKDKGLYLEYNKTTDDIPTVNVDKAKIKEAITNLVDNAVKYTKKGGVTVSVKVCSGMEKCLTASHIRITVSDTGIGVPQSEMPHLFSKFSRGKDVKRLNASGTGLGLYVVKMVIEGNHGQVWIESEGDGKGSRFIIELPVG